MKLTTAIIVCALWLDASQIMGRDLHLTSGEVFKEITVAANMPGQIMIRHSNGVATIPFSKLTFADQTELQVKEPTRADVISPPAVSSVSPSGSKNPNPPNVSAATSGVRPSTGGSVYVRGYFKKDGTYVSPHTRKR